jgi:hypothetical protein
MRSVICCMGSVAQAGKQVLGADLNIVLKYDAAADPIPTLSQG